MNSFKFIGMDVKIHPTTIFTQPHLIDIYNHVAIDAFCYIATKLTVGNYVHIAPHVTIIGGKDSQLILEDFSFIAAGTRVVCGSEDYRDGLVGPVIPKKYRNLKLTTIIFEKFSGVGVNCSIMPGVTLKEGSVLGANSLLTKDTESWGIYVGSPARRVGTRSKENIMKFASEL